MNCQLEFCYEKGEVPQYLYVNQNGRIYCGNSETAEDIPEGKVDENLQDWINTSKENDKEFVVVIQGKVTKITLGNINPLWRNRLMDIEWNADCNTFQCTVGDEKTSALEYTVGFNKSSETLLSRTSEVSLCENWTLNVLNRTITSEDTVVFYRGGVWFRDGVKNIHVNQENGWLSFKISRPEQKRVQIIEDKKPLDDVIEDNNVIEDKTPDKLIPLIRIVRDPQLPNGLPETELSNDQPETELSNDQPNEEFTELNSIDDNIKELPATWPQYESKDYDDYDWIFPFSMPDPSKKP
ncbi:MAG TPA: hypothetical protein DHV51_01560 [Opitutae bacterium]|nr:hypothetical protein [Opitutae bacterium]